MRQFFTYLEAYGPHATLKVVEGENHTITRRRKQVVAHTVEFFKTVFGKCFSVIGCIDRCAVSIN